MPKHGGAVVGTPRAPSYVNCHEDLHDLIALDSIAMSSARLKALIAERDAATTELRALRAQRKTLSNAESLVARHWQLPSDVIATVMLCYTLSEFCLEPVVKYLEHYASCHKWPVKSKEELVVMVEHVFLGADIALLADLVDPGSAQYDPAAKLASQFVEEWRIVQWATDLNSDCGVAPFPNPSSSGISYGGYRMYAAGLRPRQYVYCEFFSGYTGSRVQKLATQCQPRLAHARAMDNPKQRLRPTDGSALNAVDALDVCIECIGCTHWAHWVHCVHAFGALCALGACNGRIGRI